MKMYGSFTVNKLCFNLCSVALGVIDLNDLQVFVLNQIDPFQEKYCFCLKSLKVV